jgi:gas vesicle protein
MDDEDEARDEDQTADSIEAEPEGERGLGGFAAGVLIGAALGAGLALLLAPERGETTRRRLRQGLARLREDAEHGLERAGRRTRRELERRRRQVEDGLERVRDLR